MGFFLAYNSLSLLIGMLKPFTFNIIIDRIVFTYAMFLFGFFFFSLRVSRVEILDNNESVKPFIIIFLFKLCTVQVLL